MHPASSNQNRLGNETSPYLLQHKDNPVHWWPWGEDAFAAARASRKPVLLSVGYSACHWCHVMAHESFEDPAIAALMNAHFINIKVDREERPDVDTIYQKALALMGEQGGWPLTMFLSPDGKPFYGGTYYPPAPAYGRPSFTQVLAQIDNIWRDRQTEVAEQGAALVDAIGAHHHERLRDGLSISLLDNAADRLMDYVDLSAGGMNGAPKFPMPFVFDFLWRAYLRTGDERYYNAVTLTLTHLSQGGIYDHLGGGFARYSTDAEWLVPHFEKMLYDNAQLIDVMTVVWQRTRDPLLATRIAETIAWLAREMTGENGAFTAAFDADSEGEEGKFYVWSEAEIETLLGTGAALFKRMYDVTPDGNWDDHVILNRTASRDAALTPADEAQLARARHILFAARAQRVSPTRDDKILADWNGLAITAITRAAMAFDDAAWLALAEKAYDAVCATMTWRDAEGRARLGHSYCRGRLQSSAMIDDYANMINAALALYSAVGSPAYLQQAETWIDAANALYWDDHDDGYFFTAADAHDLVLRTKSANDSAVPSGNGSMVLALARAFYLTGKQTYRMRAAATAAALAVDAVKSFPHGATLLNGFELLETAVQVVIVGARDHDTTQALLAVLRKTSLPNLVLDIIADTTTLPSAHPAHGKTQIGKTATAYVCRGPSCSAPQTTAEGLSAALANPAASA